MLLSIGTCDGYIQHWCHQNSQCHYTQKSECLGLIQEWKALEGADVVCLETGSLSTASGVKLLSVTDQELALGFVTGRRMIRLIWQSRHQSLSLPIIRRWSDPIKCHTITKTGNPPAQEHNQLWSYCGRRASELVGQTDSNISLPWSWKNAENMV